MKTSELIALLDMSLKENGDLELLVEIAKEDVNGMKIEREESRKLLDSVDTVCMYCVMDTLNTSVCDNCPVRIMCESLDLEETE